MTPGTLARQGKTNHQLQPTPLTRVKHMPVVQGFYLVVFYLLAARARSARGSASDDGGGGLADHGGCGLL